MPDCGHYTRYRRVHATVKHFRGFVLTNCMNKFVCAQLEASGPPPVLCVHMLMLIHEVARGGVGHKRYAGCPARGSTPGHGGITKKMSARFLNATSL